MPVRRHRAGRRVCLVSCRELLDPGAESRFREALADERALHDALAAVGVDDVAHAAWDDASVSWTSFALVLVRTAWDYSASAAHAARYVAWLRRLDAEGARVVNSPALQEWNSHKGYLSDLAARGVPVIPSVLLRATGGGGAGGGDCGEGDAAPRAAPLGAIMAERGWREVMLKPCVGGGSRGCFAVRATGRAGAAGAAGSPPGAGADATGDVAAGEAWLTAARAAGDDMLVQPYLSSVEAAGEFSVIVIDACASHVVVKRPRPGDFRTQAEHGAVAESVAGGGDSSGGARAGAGEGTGGDSGGAADAASAASLDDRARALALRVVREAVAHCAAAAAAAAASRAGAGGAAAEPPAAASTGAAPPECLVARVDFLLDGEGELRVLEFEAIEPCLYFEQGGPASAARLAAVVARLLHDDGGGGSADAASAAAGGGSAGDGAGGHSPPAAH